VCTGSAAGRARLDVLRPESQRDELVATEAEDSMQAKSSRAASLVPTDLLEILCCPFEECRKPFRELLAERRLECTGCGKRYVVDEHGTPNLLREEAEPPA